MPIISQPAAPVPAPQAGEGATPCFNCDTPIAPCNCYQECGPPFRGMIHVRTGSHLCAFPQPTGSKVAQS